jgi:hypothetical protein
VLPVIKSSTLTTITKSAKSHPSVFEVDSGRSDLAAFYTSSDAFYDVCRIVCSFFCIPLEHVTPFFNHHFKAVIRDGTLVLPGTPPGTNSRHPPGTSVSAHTDENAIIHSNKPNCPAPADGIGPMSEPDPNAKNAIDPNFNNDISDNGLTVVYMSATTSIYSQCSEKSRNRVHLYAPELARAFDTILTLQLQTEPEQNQ